MALCLVGASAAYAAASMNSYTGSSLALPKSSGTSSKPAGIAWKETLAAKNTDSSKVAAVLTDIKVKIYGLTSDSKDFKTCSGKQMSAMKSDTFCPKESKFATGSVSAVLGGPTLARPGTSCKPNLDVFNGGKGKLIFFFTFKNALQCSGLTTGAVAPYTGTVTQQGKYQVTDVPLPPDVSTKVANQTNLWGSLIQEQLNWANVSKKVGGKTVYSQASVGCLKGKRPWSITFTATADGGKTHQTDTVTGSSKC
jgi:hypothetical protein